MAGVRLFLLLLIIIIRANRRLAAPILGVGGRRPGIKEGALIMAIKEGAFEDLCGTIAKSGPTARTTDNYRVLRGRLRLIRFGMFGLRVNGATGDRAAAVLALHHPSLGQP